YEIWLALAVYTIHERFSEGFRKKVARLARIVKDDIALGLAGRYKEIVFFSEVEEGNVLDDAKWIEWFPILLPSVTSLGDWGIGGYKADLTLDIANNKKMQNMICVEIMRHLTCTNMPAEKIDHVFDTIKSYGIQNVLALRGDPPHEYDKFVKTEGGFACALDLVKRKREKYTLTAHTMKFLGFENFGVYYIGGFGSCSIVGYV
ncbi:hypothetical protein GIB67_021936, partial [Kingdonia uniflora]